MKTYPVQCSPPLEYIPEFKAVIEYWKEQGYEEKDLIILETSRTFKVILDNQVIETIVYRAQPRVIYWTKEDK